MMVDKITKEQLEDLEIAEFLDTNDFNSLLEKYTGIKAKPYTGYQYFDAAGDYLADSDNTSVEELLKLADIKVVDGGAE
ncbi:MAG: hypothetical protein IKC24_00990 [Oscillospiraceae bacterium]|nr:hypothetical protein [Oscillospiraceae bacterium]MBR6677987.1 hypothetical protein [Oscillospiraceae bacterium]